MSIENNSDLKKINGRFYTPARLADLLIENCDQPSSVRKAKCKVLDPSCGDGALIKSVQKRFGSAVVCYGCDVSQKPNHVRGLRFKQGDFFDYTVKNRFSLIVTNPPYVRFTLNASNSCAWYAKSRYSDLRLDKRSDLWAYFLLKSIDLLEEGGEVAAILPWSFFFTEYAANIRSIISSHFGKIVVRILSEACFSDTPQKVVLLWLKNYGKACCKFEVGYSFGGELHHEMHIESSLSSWLDGSCMRPAAQIDVAHKNVCKMEDVSTIRIGTVPGSSKFFIWDRKSALRKNSRLTDFVPILTSSRDVVALRTGALPSDKYQYLLLLNEKNRRRYESEIEDGEKKGCNLPSHCAKRDPWYSIKVIDQEKRDAFFTYRVASLPVLILNDEGFCCTNSLHYVAFNDSISAEKKKWIQVSLLSVFSLVDVEYNARVYGSNVLKVEPSALKKVRVYCPDCPLSPKVYDEISTLVEKGERQQVIITASICIFKAMHLDRNVVQTICTTYNQLRQQRMGCDGVIDFGALYQAIDMPLAKVNVGLQR